MLFIAVKIKQKRSLKEIHFKKARVKLSHTLDALQIDRSESKMLHLLSGIPVQLQLVPPSAFFPHSHGLSDSDMEGRCNIEGRSVCALNLVSHHSALLLPEEPFDRCPLEKRALGLTGGVRRAGVIRAASRYGLRKHDSCLQSVIMVFN